jgi:hypothetical protein
MSQQPMLEISDEVYLRHTPRNFEQEGFVRLLKD